MEDVFKRSPGRKPNPPSAALVAAVKAAHKERQDQTVKEIADDLGITVKRFYECLRWQEPGT